MVAEMDQDWRFDRLRDRFRVLVLFVACFWFQNLGLCWSLNYEGLALLRFKERVVSDPFGALSNWKDYDGEVDPCSWFGVECSDGKVLVLNLKDLRLGGTLPPELKNLVHIKSIILRNNSFTGIIPDEIGELEVLKVLDLGHNNFSGPLPADLGRILSLEILLLDNNCLLSNLSPEICNIKMLPEFQVDNDWLSSVSKDRPCNKRSISRKLSQDTKFVHELLQQVAASPRPTKRIRFPAESSLPRGRKIPSVLRSPSDSEPSSAPSPSGSEPSSAPSPSSEPLSSSTKAFVAPPHKPQTNLTPVPTMSPSPVLAPQHSSKNHYKIAIVAGTMGGAVLAISIIGICIYRNNKVVTVRPWATGLSGQLQKAFVTGVPKLKRSELEAACEDFSNVIGSSPIGTLYKGTLSSGVEIAVASVAATSIQDWSKTSEVQFRKKIDTLSKVSHKNFVSLIGFCEEEEPFTRMMVFEYAPNGTLFEHIHIKEAEHLDWNMRLRIAMGMAYCLEHMHQLKPPTYHNNLNSSSVRLSEDYACKVAEFSFWNEIAAVEAKSLGTKHKTPSASLESNVYDFGVILFEMVTGRLPYSVDNVSFGNWASEYLKGEQPFKEMVDPTLCSYQEEQLELIGEVMKSCVQPDLKQRPPMKEVSDRLREITGISPDGATPRLSPLWWAELEIISTDAS